MPYITKSSREKYDDALDDLILSMELVRSHSTNGHVPEGDLNYIISTILNNFITMNHKTYSSFNSVIGVLECAKLELYRRHIGPYEDKKIAENGDIS